MADFGGGFEDNWGLQAIVRGSTTSGFSTSPADSCFLDDHHHHHLHDDDINGGFFFGFPDIDNPFQSNVAMLNDDLQEFYKPFYPVSADSSLSPATAIQDNSIPFVKNENKAETAEEYVHQLQLISPREQSQSAAACTSDHATAASIAPTPKYRKRRNQNKRVVQVQAAAGAEGLPSDMWAWRKYGQKPIKGSPFPRSYYRCSSSKGCLARKQVEQSCTEPGVFLISYAAEHNHAQPIRKNALAGTTRQKFPAPTTTTTPASWTVSSEYNKENSGNSTWSAPSPISGGDVVQLQVASIIEDGCSCSSSSVKQEFKEEENIKMEDEFFAGLEDLDGLISELASGQQQYSSKMFSMNFYS